MDYKKHMLTNTAAAEDAKLICEKIGNFLLKYIHSIHHIPPKHYEVGAEKVSFIITGKDFLKEIENLVEIDYLAVYTHNISLLYSYARGEMTPETDIQRFVAFTYESELEIIYNYIANIFFMSAAVIETKIPIHDIASLDMLQKICPRITYGLRVALARRELYLALKDEGFVSPASIALLSDVVYTYIIKVIKQGIIQAEKHNRQWQIPAKEALEFVKKYDSSFK